MPDVISFEWCPHTAGAKWRPQLSKFGPKWSLCFHLIYMLGHVNHFPLIFFQLSFCPADLLYIIWKSLKSETVILHLLESLKNSHLWGITRISYHAQTYESCNFVRHPPAVFLLVDMTILVRKTRKNSNIFIKILILWYILSRSLLSRIWAASILH